MKRHGQIERDIQALGDLVDRFGADRTRWPAPDRLRFACLLKESAEARRVLARAAALDRLLDMAPTVDAGRHEAIADRIVKQALAGGAARAPGPATTSGAVTDLAAVRSAKAVRASAGSRFGSSSWPAAALLAASLVLGIFAGSQGLLPTATFGSGGTTVASDADFGRLLALGPDVGPAADEDTL